jgi:hypothetical protein
LRVQEKGGMGLLKNGSKKFKNGDPNEDPK